MIVLFVSSFNFFPFPNEINLMSISVPALVDVYFFIYVFFENYFRSGDRPDITVMADWTL